MRIAGMDFETANTKNGSICAVGLAAFDNGELVDTREWLIKPHKSRDYFYHKFVELHGISYFDVRQAPAFADVWGTINQFLTACDVVVCHNAHFDIRHLRAVLELYQLAPVDFNYACTYELSRVKLPQLPHHNLNSVAKHFNHEFHHHDALDDAIACGVIAHRLGIENKFLKAFTKSKLP